MLIIIIIIIIIIYLIKLNIYNNLYKYIENSNEFIYNMSWEDYNIDLKYLNINNNDNVLMITSAGCNVLNTLLYEPNIIISVDISKNQNALLDLKLATIISSEYYIFWQLFGIGFYNKFKLLYFEKLRDNLQLNSSKVFWDNNLNIFNKGLYNSGSSIKSIKFLNFFIGKELKILSKIKNLDIQYKYYKKFIEKKIFNYFIINIIKTNYWKNINGIPNSQYNLICGNNFNKIIYHLKYSYDKMIKNFLINKDNYFIYCTINGTFTKNNCPDYLKYKNFNLLKNNIHKIKIYNLSITEYLKKTNLFFNKFFLLDHLDWFQNNYELLEEFFYIKKKSIKNNSLGIFKSGIFNPWYLKKINNINGINVLDISYEHLYDKLSTYRGYYLFNL